MTINIFQRLLIVALALASAILAHGKVANCNTDSLLRVLDGIVDGSEPIELNKQMSITTSRARLAQAKGDGAMFNALGEMFEQYRKYKLDSALYFALQRMEVAQRMGHPDSLAVAKMNVADGLKGLGQFVDGLKLLNEIPRDEFVENSKYYYYLLHSITLSIYNQEVDSEKSAYYIEKLRCYRDTISRVNADDPTGSTINMGEIYLSRKQYKEARNLLNGYMEKYPEAVVENAIFWCTLADVYNALDDEEAEKYCLTMGAIIDKRNCIKTYTSLQDLALLLNRQGDTERAYNYIACAMNDVMNSSARSRLLQVADAMPIIQSAYNEAQNRAKTMRRYFYTVVSVLILALLGILVALYKRNRKLIETRLIVDAKNQELVALNESLRNVNNQLGESNKIKETYIAQLFKICTDYIDDIEKYRMSLSRKLKAGQLQEIKDALSAPVTAEAMKQFLRKFDMIFLELFPNFVEDFNKLMQPGAEILPKDKESLTTELRIYALVRLGINDSTKIASFLHYSSQTVYNYRQKVRSRSIIPKGKFVEAVQSL